MAFLDNSGDIMIDVVLTDEGRRLLALGDGSFSIDKFALGDDEINYGLYNTTASSGQEDLAILQTPILEAFTNNMSSMKSHLVTYPRNDMLYLPVIKLNDARSNTARFASPRTFMVAVDDNTVDNSATTSPPTSVSLGTANSPQDGFLNGANPGGGTNLIQVDAGIDNTSMPASVPITQGDLYESSYRIDIDHRLGMIVGRNNMNFQPVHVDDDNVATYVVDINNSQHLNNLISVNTNLQTATNQVIAGARSTSLQFRIRASQDLRSSFYLFDLIGGSTTMGSPANANQPIKFIDSIVRVTGEQTGYSIDIPIRFVKNV